MSGKFSQFIKKANEKGGLVEPVRLTPQIREDIISAINEEKSMTCDMSEERFHDIMLAMNWIEHQLDKSVILFARMNKCMALTLYDFAQRHDDEYSDAMQWIFNKVNRYYAVTDVYLNAR